MNNLRKMRREKEITQYELELRTGIHQSYLSIMEKGYRKPSLSQMSLIAKGLNCDVKEVFPDA